MAEFKLSPSDFCFLWEECPRCYYLKVARGFGRPAGPFPQIFGAIDRAMTACYDGMRTEEISPQMPPGAVRFGQKRVRSGPIDVGPDGAACTLSGRFDAVVELDGGGYAVIDFKTSSVRGAGIPLYSRQLHAYAYALEHPAPGAMGLAPVSHLGLLVFEPERFAHLPGAAAHLDGKLSWIELRRDDDAFLAFLRRVVAVLAQPEPPDPAPDCGWCRYRRESRENNL